MKKIKYLLLLILGIFILSEAYLRIFKYEVLKSLKRDLAYIPDTLYGFRYKANVTEELVWPDISRKVRFNNQGFYGPDFSPIKKKDSYRIIFVGNSNTLGIRTDGMENFVIKLQNIFKKANFNIEVINCSVDGKNRDIGNMNLIKYLTPRFDPDLVLFEYQFPLSKEHIARNAYKDYMIRYKFTLQKDSLEFLHKELDKVESHKFLCKLYDCSYVVREFSNWLINNSKSKFAVFFDSHILNVLLIKAYVKKEMNWGAWTRKEKEYFSVEESIKMYSDLEKHLDSLNIRFATYTLFNRVNENHPNYPQFKINVEQNNELFLPNDGHVNNVGHNKIAEELFSALINSSYNLNLYKINNKQLTNN